MTERTLRNKMKKDGYTIKKGRDAYGMVGYQIIDIKNIIVAGEHFELDFDDVVRFVKSMLS